ncbi:MAG: hypothetical protein HUJ54_14385 [Erysipelotrichaceae bacterium]|nr:hypothetical protein [Erysipelotrichaceae bacterium]
MDAVKQYINRQLENFPDTKEVRAAREHLTKLAEDQYQQLIDQGATEFEALAQVILETGSREDIRQMICMEAALQQQTPKPEPEAQTAEMNLSEAESILKTDALSAHLSGLSAACMICSVIWALMLPGKKGVLLMVLTFAAGWGLAVWEKSVRDTTASLRHEKTELNPEAEEAVRQKWKKRKTLVLIMKGLGGLSILCSILPVLYTKNSLTISVLIAMVAFGLYLYMTAYGIELSCRRLLDPAADQKSSRRNFSKKGSKEFPASAAAPIMKIYWPAVALTAAAIGLITRQFWLSGILILTAMMFKFMINDASGKNA